MLACWAGFQVQGLFIARRRLGGPSEKFGHAGYSGAHREYSGSWYLLVFSINILKSVPVIDEVGV